MATDVTSQNNSRLILTEKISGLKFLVDTGADISVLPPLPSEKSKITSLLSLSFKSNGPEIQVYGKRKLSLDTGLCRIFPWTFTVAKVSKPILGAEFLTHYGKIVDLKSKRVIDSLTSVSSSGRIF